MIQALLDLISTKSSKLNKYYQICLKKENNVIINKNKTEKVKVNTKIAITREENVNTLGHF